MNFGTLVLMQILSLMLWLVVIEFAVCITGGFMFCPNEKLVRTS